eukprot:867615_1
MSVFFAEQESKSTSPTRKIFRAKRHGVNNNNTIFHNTWNDPFENMTDKQYTEYQQKTMAKRMKRKRNFDVFSSGSNVELHKILQNANTCRIPNYSMFYVKVVNNNTITTTTNDNNNDNNNNDNNNYSQVQEECLITLSVRVSSEWVIAYNKFEN